MMKLKPAHKKLEVVATLEALARTLITVLDALAAAGEERDDRPRQFALTCARWARDESTPAELAVANKALEVGATLQGREPVAAEQTVWPRALRFTRALASGRSELMQYPTHTKWVLHVLLIDLALVLMALGEARDAAGARVEGAFAQHFTAITGHAPTPVGVVALLASIPPGQPA